MLYLLKSTNQRNYLGFHFEKLKRKWACYLLFSRRNNRINGKIMNFSPGKPLIKNLKAAKVNEIDKLLVSLSNKKDDLDHQYGGKERRQNFRC